MIHIGGNMDMIVDDANQNVRERDTQRDGTGLAPRGSRTRAMREQELWRKGAGITARGRRNRGARE